MTPGTAVVRHGDRNDIPAAVRTLERAFVDYPFTRHVLAADDHMRRLAAFQELLVSRVGLDLGRVWVAAEARAVAVWTTPESTEAPKEMALLAPAFAEIAGARAGHLEAAEAAMQPHRPQGASWFLATVGVEPGRQGHGLGAAVLRPGIEAAERAGFPAFLETSDERNVSFYRRLGFEVTAAYELPDGGPRTWAMSRPPNASTVARSASSRDIGV